MRTLALAAWCLPSAIAGAVVLLVALLAGGASRIVISWTPASAWRLSPRASRPFGWGRGWAGLTLPPFVFVVHRASVVILRHELVHVAQGRRWGPLYLPAYAALWVREYRRTGSTAAAYDRHPWEAEARRAA